MLAVFILAIIALFVFSSTQAREKADRILNEDNKRRDRQQQYLDSRGVVIRKEHISGNIRFIVDDIHQNVYMTPYGGAFIEIPFEDIIDCEISQSQPRYETAKKGVVSRAVVGGIIAGGAGAVIGAATAKESVTVIPGYYYITIYTRNIDHPQITLSSPSQDFAANVKGSIYAIKEQRSYLSRSSASRRAIVEPSARLALPTAPVQETHKPEETWCFYCHKSVSENAASCQNCGKPLTDRTKVVQCAFCKTYILKSDTSCRKCGMKRG